MIEVAEPKDSIAVFQKRAAAADAARTAYLVNKVARPKEFDDAGLRDISAVSIKAASEIARLRGPQGRD